MRNPRANPHERSIRIDRPRAKEEGVPLASRRGCSGAIQQKKRAFFCFSCHVGNDEKNSGCCIANQKREFPKIRCDVTDRKKSQPRRAGIFLIIFFSKSTPNTTRSHRQTPPIAIARSFQHAENGRFAAAGGQSTAPLARGGPFGQEPRPGASWHLASCHSTRISGPLIPSLSFPHALTKVLPAQVARAARSWCEFCDCALEPTSGPSRVLGGHSAQRPPASRPALLCGACQAQAGPQQAARQPARARAKRPRAMPRYL